MDGKLYLIRREVEFFLPKEKINSEVWKIKSKENLDQIKLDLEDEYQIYVDFEFHPFGSREEHLNVGLIVSDFIQPFGLLSGKIVIISQSGREELIISDFLGVVETHVSVW